MLTPPRARADIVKYKPGADSHRSFLFYSVSTSVSLKVFVNGVSLAPHPSLQALMEALPQPDLSVCSKTDRSHGPGHMLRTIASSFHLSLASSSASFGSITLLACFSTLFLHLSPFSLFLQVINFLHCPLHYALAYASPHFQNGLSNVFPTSLSRE